MIPESKIIHDKLSAIEWCSTEESIKYIALLNQKLEIIRNCYSGKTCYIVATGPSVSPYKEILPIILKNQLVFTIKQAAELLRGIVDFSIADSDRAVGGEITMSMCSCEETPRSDISFWKCGGKCSNGRNWKNWPMWAENHLLFLNKVDLKLNWQKFSSYVEKKAVPVAVFTGVKKIITIGYDLSYDGGVHYYDANSKHVDEITLQRTINRVPLIKEWLESLGIEWFRLDSPYKSGLAGILPALKLDELPL